MFTIHDNAALTINGDKEGSVLFGTIMVNNTTTTSGSITINGGTYKNDIYSPIYVNGSVSTICPITINNAIINGLRSPEATQAEAGHAIYLAGINNTKITNCKIIGVNTGIEVRAGNLKITDCEVYGNDNPATVTSNGNGSTTSGAALAIAQHSTKLDIIVIVNSGTFKGVKAFTMNDPENNGLSNVKATINGGTFIGAFENNVETWTLEDNRK